MKALSLLLLMSACSCLAGPKPEVIRIVPEYEDFREDDTPEFKAWYRSFVSIAERRYHDNLNGNQDRLRPLWLAGKTPQQVVWMWYHGRL